MDISLKLNSIALAVRQAVKTISDVSWDSSADTYVVTKTGPTATHLGMRRCLLLDNGTVNYYLDPKDSTKKADGTAADLTGADGMVMVEIPKFYTKRTVVGNVTTWSIASYPEVGYTVHPAFIKDGVEVNFRYYSAYDACYLDATDSTYKSGLNLNDLTSSLDLAADKLSSVSGIYPIVGVTRAECRSLAANRGTGWRQLDWALFSAVQVLYLTEYGTFNSQSAIGNGNTRHTSWPASSSTQTDSRANVAGLSNGNGNATANDSDGTINTNDNGDYMSYRGIENFYGNVWNWADGVIVNPDGTVGTNAGDWWFTNNSADFSDSARTNMTQLSTTGPTSSNYARSLAAIDNFFIANSVTGGSATTYITDFYYGSTSADRVVFVGGNATGGLIAGAIVVRADRVSSDSFRDIGARLAF